MRQTRRYLERVPNLSAVPSSRAVNVFLVVLFGESDDFVIEGVECSFARGGSALLFDFFEAGEVEPEDFFSFGFAEGRVIEGHVDAGFDGFVESSGSVGCEEEDTVEVFKDTEEDCDKSVRVS